MNGLIVIAVRELGATAPGRRQCQANDGNRLRIEIEVLLLIVSCAGKSRLTAFLVEKKQ